MSFDFGPHGQYFFAALVLVGTYASAFVLLWIAQWSAYAGQIKTFRGIAQDFLTIIEVLFALRVYSAILRQAVEVRSARDLRIALSQTHVNPLKWFGITSSGFSPWCQSRWYTSTNPGRKLWSFCCSLRQQGLCRKHPHPTTDGCLARTDL